MEPVQRIPRYTLLWHGAVSLRGFERWLIEGPAILKCISPGSPQRIKLLEAVQIASGIAKCEPDPQTLRATVMYCLERSVDGFPVRVPWSRQCGRA